MTHDPGYRLADPPIAAAKRTEDNPLSGCRTSDGRIAEALDTSIDAIARTRQQLVEEGLDAALTQGREGRSPQIR